MSRCPRCNSIISLSQSNYCCICGFKLNDVKIIENDGFLMKEEKGVVSLLNYTGDKKDVVIPSNINVICRESFYNLDNVETIDIGDGVTIIEEQAFHCKNLKKIRIRKQVKSFTNSIMNEKRFEGLFYDGTVEDWLKINYRIFKVYPIFFKSKNGNHNFFNNRYEAIKDIDFSKKEYETLPAFVGFSELESFVFPKKVKTIKESSFFTCEKLKNIVFPEELEVIEPNAFCNCKSLVDIRIPEGIKKIDIYTFYGCSSLETIYLPKSLKKIEEDAFEECNSLKKVFYNGSEDEWRKIKNKSKEISNCTIVYL